MSSSRRPRRVGRSCSRTRSSPTSTSRASATSSIRGSRRSRSPCSTRQQMVPGLDHVTAVKNYVKALNKGILKVMAKMGISTLQSYCGAQIFEAVGLNRDVVDRYFSGTASRVSGIGLEVIAEEVRRRHEDAFPERPVGTAELDWGGEYQWRRDGEHHMVNPDLVRSEERRRGKG